MGQSAVGLRDGSHAPCRNRSGRFGTGGVAGTFRRRRLEWIYASYYATGLSTANDQWEPLLEYANAAGAGIVHIKWNVFLYGTSGIWLLPCARPVLHGVGATSFAFQ